MLASKQEATPQMKQAVMKAVGQTVGDVNGDGEVVVAVTSFAIDPDDMQAQSMIASYAVQISSGPSTLIIADEYAYEDLIRRDAVEPLYAYFTADELGSDGDYWALADSDFVKGEAFSSVSDEEIGLYRVLLRGYTGTGWETDKEKTEQFHLALETLKAMMGNTVIEVK